MSEVILKAENISKQYRLGLVGTGTISHDLNRWWSKVRGKEDPFLKVGEVNDRSTKGTSNYVWALKDINFEVKRGEVLGIIGKNGAGKSTLLKILSRVTSPTTGEIKTKGRIASLLEVGTGFHPEMTGRENIYLNGAILGMTKAEIRSKIDEIITFSGCERYIDTPVKRYSSGMTVRLAFSVAAHLEPDILVVDEVLAVGDAEFQKKAVGKMQEISKGNGRTVLFVSHNMASIKSLCNSAILLEDGRLTSSGPPEDIIALYKKNSTAKSNYKVINPNISLDKVTLLPNAELNIESDLQFKFGFSNEKSFSEDYFLDVAIKNIYDEIVLHFKMDYTNAKICFEDIGKKDVLLEINCPNLMPGEYTLSIFLYNKLESNIVWIENLCPFIIYGETSFANRKTFHSVQAKTLPKYKYNIIN